MKIYVASSWRNDQQPGVCEMLRQAGHEIYDFRNPEPGDSGFSWSSVDPNWHDWTPDAYLKALEHPAAKQGFGLDLAAMKWAEAFVLVLPSGASSHLELGWAIGMGKTSIILLDDKSEAELMYKLADYLCTSIPDVLDALEDSKPDLLPIDAGGWGAPIAARKFHYFQAGNSTSVCKNWMFTGERTPHRHGQPKQREDCSKCWTIAEALSADG